LTRGLLKVYKTSSLEVPPSPSIPFTAIDEGQASPKYIRPTMYRVPQNYTLLQSWKVPMGLIVQPMADVCEGEYELPRAEWGTDGPVRCDACGGYVNPGTEFLENGTKGRCNFWGSIFPVSDSKYSFVTDRSTLPELYNGAYEFDVCGKYIYYDVKSPTFVFIIDISAEAHANKLFEQTIRWLQNSLDSIPNQENTKIWILTVDEYVQCYTIPEDLERGPVTHQICDSLEAFLPVPSSEIMLNLTNDREKIDILLEKLLEIHTQEEAKHKIPFLNLSIAFALAYEILENCGGRILAFYSRIENVGPCKNVVLENHKLYNSDAEKGLFTPDSGFYTELSTKLFQKRITVDIFWCTYHTLNLPNPAQLCTKTGGDSYYYKSFSDRLDGEKLHYDVFRILTRNGAYDVAFRVRCSEGYAVTAYVGNFIRVNAIDFELPSIDADKTIGVVMRGEGSITNTDKLSVQAAMLYSTPDGERKIRILNLYLPLVKKFSNIIRYIDQDTLHQYIVKNSLSYIGKSKVIDIKEDLITSIIKILRAYRTDGVSITNPTEIWVPDSLNLICLYILGLLKSPAYKILGEIKVDEKYYYTLKLLGCSMSKLIKLSCPRVYKITDIETNLIYGYPDEETEKIIKPPVVDNDEENWGPYDVWIIDNGEYLYLYWGKAVSSTLIYDIFGYEDWSTLHHNGVSTLEYEMGTDAYNRVINITEQLRSENGGAYQPLQVILDGSIRHKSMKMNILIEDCINKTRDFSYTDFLGYLHNIIRKN
jgi:protein transport protein SEC24